MLKYLLIYLLFPVACLGQFTVSGHVVSLPDKKPIIKASIYLNNTTVGSTSADDGSFTLSNIRMGQYQLIVSAIGFEPHYETVNVNQNLTLPVIELQPKSIDLKDVVIKPDADWDRYYTWFKQDFFGPSVFAEQCKILNPELLDINYDKAQRVLTATSYDDLIIENRALGYRLKYRLNKFRKEMQVGYLYYEGTVLFENLPGSKSQLKKWQKNRRASFIGSAEHYFQSVLGNRVETDGFKSLTLIRKPNADRPADSLIKAKTRQFMARFPLNQIRIQKNDSLDYWLAKSRLPKTVSYLVTQPLRMDTLVKRTDVRGIFALRYPYCLYVMYTRKKGNTLSNPELNAPDYPTTVVTLTAPYAFFDYNGVILNPADVLYEGDWGTNRIAKLLPVNYDPDRDDE